MVGRTNTRSVHLNDAFGVGVSASALGIVDAADVDTFSSRGIGIDLTAPTRTSTISSAVDQTVTLGEHGYSRHLTITSTGSVIPVSAGANGVYIPARVNGANLLNMGRIEGGYGSGGAFAGMGVDVEARATITNDGSIIGGSGYISGVESGIGVNVAAQDTIVDNAGTISGGQGSGGYTGGVGIYFNVSGRLSNTGTVEGGAGSPGGESGTGGNGGVGVLIKASGVVITNAALIAGGQGGAGYDGGNGGVGIQMSSAGAVTNTGTITGGAGGGQPYYYITPAGSGGAGVDLLSGGKLTNSGTISGGHGGGTSYGSGGSGGTGVDCAEGGTISNSGAILGGNGYGGWGDRTFSGSGGAGAVVGPGATLINTGVIAGGHGGDGAHGCRGGGGGDGVYLNGATLVTSGTISGGVGGTSLVERHDGSPGEAVGFGTQAATLEVEAGAVFVGQVGANSADALLFGGTSAGTLTGLGKQITGFGTLAETAGATWTLDGTNSLSAGTTFRDAGVLSFLGTLTNKGAMDVAGGTLSLLGTTTNNGTIEAATGVVTSMYGVGGTGTLEIGAIGTLSLQNGALAGQTVDFLAATGLVELNHPLSFFGQIVGFHAGDIIDLTKPTGFAETGYSYSGGVLTIMNGSTTVASLHFQGNYTTSDFSLGTDGHGGLYLTFV